jgi:hypothetical protein
LGPDFRLFLLKGGVRLIKYPAQVAVLNLEARQTPLQNFTVPERLAQNWRQIARHRQTTSCAFIPRHQNIGGMFDTLSSRGRNTIR